MNVGIVTFHRSHSHGAFLQAYALATQLTDLGHDVQVIDYMPEHRRNILTMGRRKWSRRHLGLTMSNVARVRENWLFDRAVKRHLPLSRRRYESLAELRRCPPELDACVVGSDQIWNCDNTGGDYDEAYFGGFGPDRMLRIAYAASFGRTAPPKHGERLKHCLNLLDRVSVRERSGIDVVTANSSHTPCRVLDPTLLIDASRYPRTPRRPTFEPYVLAYLLQSNAYTDGVLQRVAEGLKLPVVHADTAIRFMGRNLGRPDPLQFLQLVRRAAHVVTNSFHGLALSVVHRVDFTCTGLVAEHAPKSTRLTELLSEFGLSGRFVDETNAASAAGIAQSPLDWSPCESALSRLRHESIEFLQHSLGRDGTAP